MALWVAVWMLVGIGGLWLSLCALGDALAWWAGVLDRADERRFGLIAADEVRVGDRRIPR